MNRALSRSEAVAHSTRTTEPSGLALNSSSVIGSGLLWEMDAKVHAVVPALNRLWTAAVGMVPEAKVPTAPPFPRSRQVPGAGKAVSSQRATRNSVRSVTPQLAGASHVSETTAFGVPTLRSMVQYSQVLTWCKVGSPVLPHTAAEIGKYSARNASVTEPLMLLTPQGRYSLPLPTGKEKFVLPIFSIGPFTKLLSLPPETLLPARMVSNSVAVEFTTPFVSVRTPRTATGAFKLRLPPALFKDRFVITSWNPVVEMLCEPRPLKRSVPKVSSKVASVGPALL